ncbi:hypothetical protein [Nocardioides aurantiacus]|uniref:Uncharacterized protein n=1 Tax=Nocardioides aurantiacus TaxID=86796 RepID=A0A3N2CZH0_9ACTN|nr:hypothetical protein [Nocardioides aurantiacus]ROR92873.1 hypothetical protein EDD33_3774 [Nocardioides aurantiacus]
MTTQHLGRPLDTDVADEEQESRTQLDGLFEASPASSSHTSAAAVLAFVAGTAAVLLSPFSLHLGLAVVLAVVALVASVVGLARASRPGTAGTVLASLGMVAALATAAVVGLRYAGIDTAVADGLGPALRDASEALTALFPRP